MKPKIFTILCSALVAWSLPYAPSLQAETDQPKALESYLKEGFQFRELGSGNIDRWSFTLGQVQLIQGLEYVIVVEFESEIGDADLYLIEAVTDDTGSESTEPIFSAAAYDIAVENAGKSPALRFRPKDNFNGMVAVDLLDAKNESVGFRIYLGIK